MGQVEQEGEESLRKTCTPLTLTSTSNCKFSDQTKKWFEADHHSKFVKSENGLNRAFLNKSIEKKQLHFS